MSNRNVALRDGMFQVEVGEIGDGPPLLYLHGIWDGSDNPLVSKLSEHFRVITPYHPGFGGTTGEENLRNIHDVLIYFSDLLDEIGFFNGPVVGHCLGGMFAAELAAVQPTRVTSIVLISPFGLWIEENPTLDIFAVGPQELAAALYGASGPNGIAGTAPIRPGSSEPAGLSDHERVERSLERTRAMAGAARFLWPIPDRGLVGRLHRLPARTLLIWGGEDRVVPRPYATMLQEGVPGSRLEVVDHAAHLVHYQDPGRVTDLIKDHVRGPR